MGREICETTRRLPIPNGLRDQLPIRSSSGDPGISGGVGSWESGERQPLGNRLFGATCFRGLMRIRIHCLALLWTVGVLLPATAYAQADFSGVWQPHYDEDNPE